MLFKELIEILKQVKTPDEPLPIELYDHLMNACITVGMHQMMIFDENLEPEEALKNLKIGINKHIDWILEEMNK